MQPSEILQQMQDVIAERGWRQGHLQRHDQVEVCIGRSFYEVTRESLYSDDALALGRYIVAAIGGADEANPWKTVIRFNDNAATSYEDMQLVLKQARELAELDEGPL